jgi:hypothetical protein
MWERAHTTFEVDRDQLGDDRGLELAARHARRRHGRVVDQHVDTAARRTRLIRRLAAVTIIVVACFGWKLLKRALRSEANKQLEQRQDLAREKIGHGLDELFEETLDRDSTVVVVDAKFAIDPTLGGLTPDQCLRGLDAAFEDRLARTS